MKNLFASIFIFLTFSVFSQTDREFIPDSWYDSSPVFSNQSEIEDYWSWRYFTDEYEYKKSDRYNGKIHSDEGIIYFGDISSVRCESCSVEIKEIFLKGVFYPKLIEMSSIRISNLEELKFLSNSFTKKRYRFWIWYENMLNPEVYLFEVENKKATNVTSFVDFMRGGNVTFVKKGWIII